MRLSVPTSEHTEAPALPLVGEHESVLVVDDEATFRELARVLLSSRRGETIVVSSVAEAIAVLEARPVDVVVSDHSMPQATGLNLLAYIRCRGLDVRFVLASALLPPGVADRARAAGARVLAKAELVELLAA